MRRTALLAILALLGLSACRGEIEYRGSAAPDGTAVALGDASLAHPPADSTQTSDALPAMLPDGSLTGDAAPPGTDAGTQPQDAVAENATPPTCLSGAPPALGDITAEELHEALSHKDFLLINVASPPNIPLTDAVIGYTQVDALVAFIGPDRERSVVLYCQSGGRSRSAGNALVSMGYCNIRQLVGGKSAWVAAGYPLEE